MRFVAAALLFAAATAAAEDYPKLKPGLWEMSIMTGRREGQAPLKNSICLDDSVQQEMYKMGMGAVSGMCSKHEIKYSGNKVTGSAVCDLGGTTMTSRSVMTLSGNTSYRTESHATFDPPMAGKAESDTVMEAKHIGACPAGQKPGDMTTGNGRTINIRQMMDAKGAQGAKK